MKNSKKGFTLVELIIVVAVIALLAAVLIPTFSSLISKANQAKDEALVSNLNKAIALSTEKYDTVYDVLGAVKENAGFDVAKISASVSEHEILWDSVNYCFVYKTEKGITGIPDTQTNKDVKDYQYWQFLSKEIPAVENQKYSIYWAGADLAEANVAVGFDAGEASIGVVNYANASATKEVLIRTEGGNLNIDAAQDTVKHYGSVDKVVIEKIAYESYHENGNVAMSIEVKDGHVAIESAATVKEVIVPQNANVQTKVDIKAEATVNTVVVDSAVAKVEVKSGAIVSNVVAASGNANVSVPESIVANKTEKTEVANANELESAVNNDSKYIVLTQDISVTTILQVKKSMVIDGQGHKLTSTANRVIRMTADNVDLVVKNISVECLNNGEDTRAISLDSGLDGLYLTVENSSLKAGYYTINITGKNGNGSSNVNVKIFNSTIEGWAAINNHASNASFVINNSTLIGTNRMPAGSETNDFATIVFDGGSFFDESSTIVASKLVVNNSIIKQISINGKEQRAFSSQYGDLSSEVWFNNVKFEHEGENTNKIYNVEPGTNIKIYIDRKLVVDSKQ